QLRKSPLRAARSRATCQAPSSRHTTRLRALAAALRLRQALAESQACRPIESPWTLPAGLLGASSRGRPLSRRINWLAASETASPTAPGVLPPPPPNPPAPAPPPPLPP